MRLSFLENGALQTGQETLKPMWMRRWRFRLQVTEKLFPQMWQIIREEGDWILVLLKVRSPVMSGVFVSLRERESSCCLLSAANHLPGKLISCTTCLDHVARVTTRLQLEHVSIRREGWMGSDNWGVEVLIFGSDASNHCWDRHSMSWWAELGIKC
jgi:hypothetical protein